MADIRGNFVNPAYASPEQIRFLREYAKQLQTEQPVHHWAQGVSNVVRALVGGLESGRADTQEQASKREYAKQLMGALEEYRRSGNKDPAALLGAAAHPMADPIQALLISKMIQPGPPTTRTAEGVSITEPTSPAAAPMAGSTEPIQPNRVQTVPVRPPAPGSQNLTGAGKDVLVNPPSNFADRYAGMDPGIAKLMPTADIMRQRKLEEQAIGGRQQEAEKARAGYVSSGEAAKPKMANIKQLYQMSRDMDEPGARGRLQQLAKDAFGLDLGPNADQYAIFDSILKSLAPEAVQQLASTGRISPAVLQQYIAKGPQFWQNRPVRNSILNAMAMPLDLAIRQGHKALSVADPLQAQQHVYNIQPDQTPLDRPPIGMKHGNFTYMGGDPNDQGSWE